jgi:predicted metal-dependent hydrolase
MKTSGTTGRFAVSRGETRVYYPANEHIESERVQRMIRIALEATWRVEAMKYLPARLRELSMEHGFQYNRVFIRNNRSRWGSCSAGNNINLNLHLMRLPDELIDYVLMHELVHTRHNFFGPRWSIAFPGQKKKTGD